MHRNQIMLEAGACDALPPPPSCPEFVRPLLRYGSLHCTQCVGAFHISVFLICKALVPVLIDSSITRYLILVLSAVMYREHTTHVSLFISKTYDYAHYDIYDTKTREHARVIAYLLFSSGI